MMEWKTLFPIVRILFSQPNGFCYYFNLKQSNELKMCILYWSLFKWHVLFLKRKKCKKTRKSCQAAWYQIQWANISLNFNRKELDGFGSSFAPWIQWETDNNANTAHTHIYTRPKKEERMKSNPKLKGIVNKIGEDEMQMNEIERSI